MPEGPEIRREADRIAKFLLGERIEQARLRLPALQRFEKRLTGATVTAVDTRGKAILTRFDDDLTLYTHNQLYGRWYTMKRPHMPRTNRQLRVALHTHTHSALLYSASDIEVLTETQLARHPFLSRIGPDILDKNLTEEQIVERLGSRRFRNRALGSLYLDQGYLAGIGNYLRSEILWAAKVDPRRKPSELERAQLGRLAAETLRLSWRSYRTRGVTVAPRLVRQLKEQDLSFQKYRFYVFGRDGHACYECGTPVTRDTMGSRRIYICPSCQA